MEDVDTQIQYNWDWISTPGNTVVFTEKGDILFHPIYSSGTAIVRGCKPFLKNRHYFWEFKICSKLYGTDVMIGVGTKENYLNYYRYFFYSALGSNKFSWGFSYRGLLQHDSIFKEYGTRYGNGSFIGMHLDMYLGTLEYYINRVPCGIAFDNLKDKEIYPMICSTASNSSMKLTCNIMEFDSLQMQCLQIINKKPKLLKQCEDIPGFKQLIRKNYFWLMPPKIAT